MPPFSSSCFPLALSTYAYQLRRRLSQTNCQLIADACRSRSLAKLGEDVASSLVLPALRGRVIIRKIAADGAAVCVVSVVSIDAVQAALRTRTVNWLIGTKETG